MKNIFLTILFLPLAIACTTNTAIKSDTSLTSNDKNSSGYRCERVTQVGSHLKTKICTTQAQRDAAKIQSDEFKAEMRSQRQTQTTEINKN